VERVEGVDHGVDAAGPGLEDGGGVDGDPAEAERLFNALSENGNVSMPFQKTFWSPGFGMCVDQFGIPWMINTEGEAQG